MYPFVKKHVDRSACLLHVYCGYVAGLCFSNEFLHSVKDQNIQMKSLSMIYAEMVVKGDFSIAGLH